jgi:hypothetical protein
VACQRCRLLFCRPVAMRLIAAPRGYGGGARIEVGQAREHGGWGKTEQSLRRCDLVVTAALLQRSQRVGSGTSRRVHDIREVPSSLLVLHTPRAQVRQSSDELGQPKLGRTRAAGRDRMIPAVLEEGTAP